MKVAIVHDQLQEFGGAERVLVELLTIFPDAHVYTSFFNPNGLGTHRKLLKNKTIQTSVFDRIPFMKKLYSPFRFITPWIWESLDLKEYDLVISSSGSYMSKGVITRPETVHICYLHHPPRSLYYYETAIEWQKYLPIRIYGHMVNHDLRLWDYLSSQRVDHFIANSEETKKRIQKFYRRDAAVIYPPVDIPKTISKQPSNHPLREASQSPIINYYLTVSRLARAKHIETLIHTANKAQFLLKIVGTGRDQSYLQSIAGKTVEFLGNLSDAEMQTLYQGAKAFLFSSVDEEFGIAPVEAMGWEVPVIAYRSGGVPEYVSNGNNGYLFDRLDADSLIEKVNELMKLPEDKYLEMRKNARKTAERFSSENFKRELTSFIRSVLPQ